MIDFVELASSVDFIELKVPRSSASMRVNYSPAFSLVNLQVGKTLFERLEIYSDVENLFDFRQKDPIVAGDDPFGPYFDSSLICGPVFGRKLYTGLRFRVN